MAETAPVFKIFLSDGSTVEPFAAYEVTEEGQTGLGVFIQDQATPPLFAKANKVITQNTLAVDVVIHEYTATLTDATGFNIGDTIVLTSTIGHRYFFGEILNIATNTLTLDRQIDYAFEAGQQASAVTTNLSVDGSTTPVVFGLRSSEPVGGIDVTVDITQIVVVCETANPVDLSKFGDLAALTRGIQIRRRDGMTQNIVNWKTNFDIDQTTGDWTPYAATNPAQGQDGFSATLKLAGQENNGVVTRLGPLEELEIIVQDNLTLLTKLEFMIKGHVVQ